MHDYKYYNTHIPLVAYAVTFSVNDFWRKHFNQISALLLTAKNRIIAPNFKVFLYHKYVFGLDIRFFGYRFFVRLSLSWTIVIYLQKHIYDSYIFLVEEKYRDQDMVFSYIFNQ